MTLKQLPMPPKTKPENKGSLNSTLHALTSAALVLPGLILEPSKAAETDSAEFQYSRYEEGKRDLFNVPNNLDPIEVNSIYGNSSISLSDRLKFGFKYTQDTWSGATPVSTAPLAANSNRRILSNSSDGVVVVGASPVLNSRIKLDQQLNPLTIDSLTGEVIGANTQLVHVISSASPETRKKGDFNLNYEWDEVTFEIAGGISLENDYESHYGGINGRWDFNQKLTSFQWGVNYSNSDTTAILDHDAAPYITKTAFLNQIEFRGGSEILHGNKEDWSTHLGLTQTLNKDAILDASFGYTHSSGFMENPYKAVTTIFIDPDTIPTAPDASITGEVRALLEQRPDTRNQFTFKTKYVQYIEPVDAALHLNYQFSHDDWGVNAHTFEANWVQPMGGGWTITPRIRYYSQESADFYHPFLISQQPFNQPVIDDSGREVWVDADNPNNGTEYFRDENFNLVDADGNPVDESTTNVQQKTTQFDAKKLPKNFSSDHRLSGYGALSGGVTIAKQLAKGVMLEAGFEYYTHAGSLKIGGNGENRFADFDYFVANAAIKIDLAALSFGGSNFKHLKHIDHNGHHQHNHHAAPAGVMFAHMMPETGDFMVGYRYKYGRKGGDTLHGTEVASDRAIVNNGCSDSTQCRFTPPYMEMNMHMLNFMYAPTDWLNLMVMPMFVDMEMNLRTLAGRPPPSPEIHEHVGIAGHTTGGIGDTTLSALLKLYDDEVHHLHFGLGINAPTGDVDLVFRRTFQQDGGLVHFGMQLGSGTWDLQPNLTYTGQFERWSWGAQLNGIKRLEDRNESGYRLGDLFQGTAWGSYKLTPWLSASIRGIYTVQGSIQGNFNSFNGQSGPMDFPANHGGRFWDVGFGLSATVPKGDLQGNQLSFEWLQPVQDDVNGFQLEREGALSVSWSYAF